MTWPDPLWAQALAVLALLGASAALASLWGAWRWQRATRAWFRRLSAAATVAPPLTAQDAQAGQALADLPAPVQRYLNAVLRPGAADIVGVEMRHHGQFNLGDDAQQWRPFQSHQVVTTRPPGFVWDARVDMLPGLPVRVHDAYVAGDGLLHAAVRGLITVAHAHGGADIAAGELMRYLAEAAWYPTALRPGPNLRWDPVDSRAARATLRDGALSVSLVFEFADNGLIDSVRAEARGRRVGDQVVATPWEGRWLDYRWHGDVCIPMRGEVAWLLPRGRLPYWRGEVTQVVHQVVPPLSGH